MKTGWIIVLGVFAGVVIMAGGFAMGQMALQPRIQGLEAQVVDLGSKVTDLESQNASLELTNDQLTTTVSETATALATSETKRKQTEADLATAQQNIMTYKSQVESYKSQVDSLSAQRSALSAQVTAAQTQASSMQKRLDTILGVTVIQHYNWSTYTWDLSIPISLYDEYKERPRPIAHSSWVDMAKDTKDAAYINQMVAYVNDHAKKYGMTDTQKLNFVVTFVQSMPYTVDSVTEGMDEYPRYPIETLFDRGGDCEDTSILTASILYRMGYDVALVELPGHMAVGVAVSSATGRYYQYGSKRYFYLETTGDGWRIGEMPAEFINVSARIYPVN